MTKEQAKAKTAELVAKFESLTPMKLKDYNEQATKNGFIEPLFRALGWDTENTDEVSPEENASKGRVDYAFKLHGVSQFYVEAKPIKADINNPDYIKQAVTYAYNRGVTWAVLTNFENLRIFNAQKQLQSITLESKQFLENFDLLWLLSRESLETGLLTKETQKWGILPPPLPIEKRLFTQLRQWREELFNQLYGHNKELLNFSQIDEVIQRLFNRLIFIRNAEDRGIEEKRLLSAVNQWKSGGHKKDVLRKALAQIFHDYDGYYDSDLFALHLLDNEKLFIEEMTLEGILNGLYEIPGSMASYDFSVIDADVLGAVYEQYLGYVAVKAKEKAEAQLKLGISDDEVFTVTSKKSHCKEQGIYYTPKFITDYIVKETVGRFIKERHGQEVLGIKILDPACGSGSFLIRAYDELLNYHADQHGKHSGQLDQHERLTILLKNIFGVDLDRQAVEIARLNLLLRSLAKRELLPSLADNIKEGNSLISGTGSVLKKYFSDGWAEKKPFNWDEQFPEVMKNGGFDVVIGNPPYGIIFEELEKAYLEREYPTFVRNNDIFVAFMEKAIRLLKDGGFFAFIIPNTFLIGSYFNRLKENLLSTCKIIKIINLGIVHVFNEPNVFNAIIIVQKESNQKKRNNHIAMLIEATDVEIIKTENLKIHPRKQAELADLHWKPMDIVTQKVMKITPSLGDIAEVKDVGLNYWTIGRGKTRGESIGSRILYDGAPQHSDDIPFLKGRDIQRYYLSFGSHYLRHNYKKILDPTSDVFGFGKPYFERVDKIVYRQTADRIIACIDKNKYFVDKTLHIIVLKNAYLGKLDILYLLGILNSKLASYVYQCLTGEKARLFAQVKTFIMKKIPIPLVDNKQVDKKLNDLLVKFVNKMLILTKEHSGASQYDSEKKQQLEKEIKATDEKIDNLVYDLYGLTDKEREIVEGSI